MKLAGLILLLLALAAPAACAAPAQEDIAATANRVADWQLANLESLDGIRTFHGRTAQQRGWVRAAFYIGLERWQGVTGDATYLQALYAMAEANEWRLDDRFWHADDQAIAQVYLGLEDADIGPTQRAFDEVLALNPRNSLEFTPPTEQDVEGGCQKRWCWCDALFMAPPAWAALTNVTGDPKYLDYAVREYLATRDYLFDDELKLFYRDSRFFERRSDYGNKVFWGRGNGWVFAGLPLMLEQMPADHPARVEFIETFVAMAERFRLIQTEAGLWAPSLLDYDQDPAPETSGSAFVVFGLAWGVNRGILVAEEYAPVIDRAWSALVAAVDDNGKLGWVQQVGNAPDEVRATDSQFYGVGAFLLAASEMVRLRAD
jgi:rhamnogalacturonyl hydrolase YesR